MNPLQAYLSQQLRHPSGWVGRFILRLLNRENAPMNQLTLSHLMLQGGQQVLEIGFGGGDLITRLLNAQPSLLITGIDPSAAAIATVRNRFKTEIAQNQLTLQQARAEALPFPNAVFDAIATVNTLYFWSDTPTVLQECHRVLKSGGKIVISYNSKAFLEQHQATQHGFRAYEVAEVEALLQEAGFRQIQTHTEKSRSNGQFYCSCGVIPNEGEP